MKQYKHTLFAGMVENDDGDWVKKDEVNAEIDFWKNRCIKKEIDYSEEVCQRGKITLLIGLLNIFCLINIIPLFCTFNFISWF